jgi:hypothetical protein
MPIAYRTAQADQMAHTACFDESIDELTGLVELSVGAKQITDLETQFGLTID